ncbi:4-oxalocrotonate tautomerase [Nocardia transvalensis]|uniref:4-oxalocrotonate tautomerase n=1 Tax=Nocardia transvalensis TaxID=37333 RepID=A0A7W9PAG4_9NOCA|nr:hypothetical protein [Nocardia transvalensis]MBB5912104.1 4-oxalocrotonate tautomerase [Nocardia transvalensis]
MPHVEISHFPADLSDTTRRRLESDLVEAITRAFGVSADAVSIGLAPVDRDHWQTRVYDPLITDRAPGTPLLRTPGY